jgi:YidC/Oxa1 family membrane protein insertase
VENSRDTPEVVVGFNEEGKFVGFDHTAGGYFKEGVEPKSLADPKRPLMWAGITSAYFDSIVLLPNADQLADVRARAIAKADGITGQEYLALTFVTGKLTVPAQATGAATTASLLTMPLEVYLGPRHRELLGNSYYARFPRGYDDTIVIKSKGFPGSICAACTWGWLIDGLVWVLNRFHFVLRDWGLAIILLVVIVRLMLHPITKRSQVSMQKMTKMGPEIERLKKKFGDDKEGLNRAMMDFYREHGYGRDQILGCLPMFLQMPIWIALWTALQGTFELRHSSFLWGFTWVKDLAQPDRLIPFHHTYTLIFGWTVDAVNLLPILLGVVFYLQQKMAPKPASETPEQAQQRKMMSWMSLLFPLILYNGPAGLNLYIFASTAIGIWESKRVRDHIKAQEAAETAGKVIVDAGSKRASKRLAGPEQVQQPGCLTGWLGNLQKKAEQMRDESQKKRPKR